MPIAVLAVGLAAMPLLAAEPSSIPANTWVRLADCPGDAVGREVPPGRAATWCCEPTGTVFLRYGGYTPRFSNAMDPAGKFLRPRKTDDPKDLVSPFAKPDIAFAWIIGVAVTDRYAYVADEINKRILRIRLDYGCQETCDVK